MENKIKLFPLILAVLIVNAVGILLRSFNLAPYIIIIGFRFHISLVIPLLIVFRKNQLVLFKSIFVNPQHKRTALPLLWILIPLLLIIGSLYFLQYLNSADPEYFYEFGLSSIVDYPVYLIWNFPQLFAFFLFLILTFDFKNKKFINPFLFTILLFAFEFIPINTKNYNYFNLISLILVSISVGLIIKYFQNIYWFVIFVFSIFWLHFLAFGSNSTEIINLLFASQYSGWEGFFEISKQLSNYILPIQLLITMGVIFISSLFRKREAL
ncbi:MAG TPA: hypothetical protein VKA26_15285 [Ignavibacteriaceae bacterium]|nr:hypothetical protein [Ignavibacteriaceae bacterium]